MAVEKVKRTINNVSGVFLKEGADDIGLWHDHAGYVQLE